MFLMYFYLLSFYIIHFVDIFSVGQWKKFEAKSGLDPVLDDLLTLLPSYTMASTADTILKKYRYAFNSWCKWSNLHSFPSLPASQFSIALYLIHLSESSKSTSKIDEAMYAISWAHTLSGFSDPCKSNLVRSVREGAHRKIGHIVKKKEPITPDILQKMVSTYGSNNCNLKDLRIATMCLVSYAGLLRFAELANIKRSNVVFCSSHVKLNLEKSKTDI